jgi:hypothetical protein
VRVGKIAMTASVCAVAALLAFGLTFALRPASRGGAHCGNVLMPTDVEQFGPAGTEPRPCRGSHDSDAQIAVLALVGAALIGTGLAVRLALTRPTRSPQHAHTGTPG